MDVYRPDEARRVLPPVLILQGADVDKSRYSRLASGLRACGHRVVVPNCVPPGRDYLCPDETAVRRALASLADASPECLAAFTAEGALLVGHSAGGIAALESVADWRRAGFALRGVALYGSNVPRSVAASRVGPPVMMMCGTDDSVVTPDVARRAFHAVGWSPKALLEMPAMDHFAIVDDGVGDRFERGCLRGADGPSDDRIDRLVQAIGAFSTAVTAPSARWAEEFTRRLAGVILG